MLAYDHHGVLYFKCDTRFWTQIWCKFITGVLRDTVINSVLFLSVKWRLFLSFLLLLWGQKCFSLHLQWILHWRIFQILFFLSFPNDIFSLEHSLNTHIFFSSTFLWPRIQNARVGRHCLLTRNCRLHPIYFFLAYYLFWCWSPAKRCEEN